MKFTLAFAAVLAFAVCIEATGPSIYNKNTNVNKNKNKDVAQVWSAIYDALLSSQTAIQQQEQEQICIKFPHLCSRPKRSLDGSFPRIYNKNTNVNRNKNQVAADVWSAIYDRLTSQQVAIQQQAQIQLCEKCPSCSGCSKPF